MFHGRLDLGEIVKRVLKYLIEGGEIIVIKDTLNRSCNKKRKFKIKLSCKWESRKDTYTTDWSEEGQSEFNLGDLSKGTDEINLDCLPKD